MAHSYKNIVITPNTGASSDPTVQFSGGNTTVNTDITLRVYPDSNGTLSFEGSAGQLFSITNDLSNSIFSVNDVSGIPLIEVNVSSQQITLGEFYGNVGVGKSSSTSSIYKLDVNGTINASNVLINGSPITGVANLTPANGYTNTSTTAANNYAGVMANSANGYATTINDANLVVARAYTNTSTTAANNYAGVMANSVNAYANTLGTNTSLAYSWTNTHTFSANVFYRNTSNLVWITNSASTVSNVSLRNYPDSNGTLSFEGSAGQLFSITNDLTGSIFSVNDVSGIPSIDVQANGHISIAPFGGNVSFDSNTLFVDSVGNEVGIGTTTPGYTLDVIGSANISSPTLLVAGQNVLASFASLRSINVSTTGPTNNTNGTLWWNSELGRLFVYYTDGNSNQWVETSPSTSGSASISANSANAYTNTSVAAANNYTNTSVTAANNYTNTSVTAANNFANTKLANTNVVLAGNLTSTQSVADRVGDLRNLPIVNQSSSYTLSLADNGEVISITTGNVFVTAGVFSPGNTISIFNNSSANITITQNTSVTMYSAGTANTGNRILQQRGIATLVCVAANTFVVTGAGMVP